jgi:hypothetical protein
MRLTTLVITLGVIFSTIGCLNEAPRNLQPVVAVYGCYTMLTPVSPDGPAPGPDGKVLCDNCGGPPGKVGDGSVMVDCPVCDGGYVMPDEQAVVHPVTVPLDTLPAARPPKAKPIVSPPQSVRVECEDGSCRIAR